nr:DUF4231 domain-containing protein [Streptomyces sp. C1-2]
MVDVDERALPPLFIENDRLALSRQSEALRATRTQLTVLLSGTAAATLTEHWLGRFWATLAALCYALAAVLGLYTARRRARAHWQAHRAAAEVVKSLAWQYMVHGGAFRTGVVDPDGLFAERLADRLRELRKVGWEDHGGATGGLALVSIAMQITPQMRAVRAKPFEARRDYYVRERVLEQLVWYGKRSAQAHRASSRWSAATAALTLLALVTAALRAYGLLGNWDLNGLFSAAAAAGVAWQEVRRHRPLEYAHALIEQDLDTARLAMGTTVTEEGWADAVEDVERLCSPQHTDWLVRFGS